MERRDFLKTALTIGAGSMLHPTLAEARRFLPAAQYFSLHPFIEAHPEAVFILRTSVSSKTATDEKIQAGKDFAMSVFGLSDTAGIPLTSLMAIKPNLTCTSGLADTVENMGIRTDTPFMEGLVNGISQVGFPSANMYIREGNWAGNGACTDDRLVGGMKEMAVRTGVHLFDFPSGRALNELTFDSLVDGKEVIWKDCAGGTVFRRVGFIHPFNAQNSWILNVAKFKTHGMGMTLCAKNLQGTVVSPLISFCETVDSIKTRPQNVLNNFQPDVETHIDALYARHSSMPRWQRAGRDSGGGYGMETWAQRTCDSHAVMNTGFHIIEGLYGRNGNGFQLGPDPNGKAQDFLTNILIFGKNAFLVDVIGHWLGGHEPGNFGLFHIAKERGLLSTCNPHAIPVYLWANSTATLTPLASFTRTPLVTPYLRRDYNGQTEEYYHLVNEPYDYEVPVDNTPRIPQTCILGQNHANPFRSSTVIDYSIPSNGHVTLEIFNEAGEKIDVLVDTWRAAGSHMATWEVNGRPAGAYFYRLRTNGFTQTKKMIVR
jgi:hypothetical protein